MAEVGLVRSAEIIVETVLKAVAAVSGELATDSGARSGAQSEPTAASNGHAVPALTTAPTFTPCPITFAATWLGISGCDTPLDQARMSAHLAPFFGSPPDVHNDALLLGGALLRHGAPWGIALIAGTGSIAVALELDGAGSGSVSGSGVRQAARRGGHGYLLGDDGSAWDVGRWAVRVVVDAYDAGEEAEHSEAEVGKVDGEGQANGGKGSTLAATVRAHFGIKSTPEVLGKVHELGPGSPIEATNAAKLRVTSLARAVLAALDEGDPLAEKAVRAAAGPLAMSAVQLVRQMRRRRRATGRVAGPEAESGEDKSGEEVHAPMLVCAGGCIRQPKYRALVLEMCKAHGVVFDSVVVVDDVAGEAALGLVERERNRV